MSSDSILKPSTLYFLCKLKKPKLTLEKLANKPRFYVLNEIVCTEVDYLNDLAFIICVRFFFIFLNFIFLLNFINLIFF